MEAPVRPTFSGLWHRVRHLRPMLRAQVQVSRQRYRGRAWRVLRDPTSGRFFRVDEAGWSFVGRLDGRRSVESIWNGLLEEDADAAPTQGEVVALLGRLSAANLVRSEASVETEQLLRRSSERKEQRAKSTLMNVLFFRVPVFNPDALVSWIEPVFRPALNRFGLAAWAAFMVFVIVKLVPAGDRLGEALGQAIAPRNVVWLLGVYVVAKALHELGHAVMVKRFGGAVPECGVMLLVLVPSPYVDASAAWSLESRWKRAAVGAAGMIFELALAGGAALVWLATPTGEVVNQLAFNAMLTAGVSTVLFNTNPLMRFDGYFILSDLLDMPNLMQRSFQQLKHLGVRLLYSAAKPEAPTASGAGERSVLTAYGLSAMAYRVVLFVGITMLLMERLFAIGLVLALWTGGVWLIGPLLKWARYLVSDRALERMRWRAGLVTAAVVIGAGAAIGLVPMPDVRSAPGVLVSDAQTPVYVRVAGAVVSAPVAEGHAVRKDQPIVVLSNPGLEARLAAARGQLGVLEGLERAAVDRSPATVDLAQQRTRAQRVVVEELEQQVERLTVRAPHDGVIVGGDPAEALGAWMNAGARVCIVVDADRLHVEASAAQRDASWLAALDRAAYGVEVRRVGAIDDVATGGAVDVAPAGRRDLAHEALGVMGGGGVVTEAGAQDVATTRRFPVRIEAAGLGGAPGERVRVRFVLPARPLLRQWSERLARVIQDKVEL